jgi:L-rhamnose-H+ transport protein
VDTGAVATINRQSLGEKGGLPGPQIFGLLVRNAAGPEPTARARRFDLDDVAGFCQGDSDRMTPNPFFGVVLHSIGGLAAGSFYIPFRKVKRWAWESYWLIQGLAAWIVMPSLVSAFTVPHLLGVMSAVEWQTCLSVYLFGVLWGIGGLTFGLSVRYLGMSLGYAVALGFCAAFGTLVPAIIREAFPADLMVWLLSRPRVGAAFPAIIREDFPSNLTALSGLAILGGVATCLAGIAICGYAGVRKERALTDEQKKETIQEFALVKGFAVAVFAGVMSACMAFAFAVGEPIRQAAKDAGTEVFANNPVFIIAMAGGFTTNFLWCLVLNIRNRSIRDYVSGSAAQLAPNYCLAGLAGTIWYLQFFFYGMGTAMIGKRYGFSSWTIHMAFIIVFSNLWGIHFKEWKGVERRTLRLVWAGILVLILSTVVIGWGNKLAIKPDGPAPDEAAAATQPLREQSACRKKP